MIFLLKFEGIEVKIADMLKFSQCQCHTTQIIHKKIISSKTESTTYFR